MEPAFQEFSRDGALPFEKNVAELTEQCLEHESRDVRCDEGPVEGAGQFPGGVLHFARDKGRCS